MDCFSTRMYFREGANGAEPELKCLNSGGHMMKAGRWEDDAVGEMEISYLKGCLDTTR